LLENKVPIIVSSSDKILVKNLKSQFSIFVRAFDTDENDTISLFINTNNSIIVENNISQQVTNKDKTFNITFLLKNIKSLEYPLIK
jgi:hypothetical protein